MIRRITFLCLTIASLTIFSGFSGCEKIYRSKVESNSKELLEANKSMEAGGDYNSIMNCLGEDILSKIEVLQSVWNQLNVPKEEEMKKTTPTMEITIERIYYYYDCVDSFAVGIKTYNAIKDLPSNEKADSLRSAVESWMRGYGQIQSILDGKVKLKEKVIKNETIEYRPKSNIGGPSNKRLILRGNGQDFISIEAKTDQGEKILDKLDESFNESLQE